MEKCDLSGGWPGFMKGPCEGGLAGDSIANGALRENTCFDRWGFAGRGNGDSGFLSSTPDSTIYAREDNISIHFSNKP